MLQFLLRVDQERNELFQMLTPNWKAAEIQLKSSDGQQCGATERRRNSALCLTACTALLAAISLIWLITWISGLVDKPSAAAVLANAEGSERKQIPDHEALYQEIRLWRNSETKNASAVLLRTWRSRDHQRKLSQGNLEVWQEWRRIGEETFQTDNPLSPGSFARWASRCADVQVQTEPDGEVEVIAHRRLPVNRGRIVEAVLILRKTDWHAVAARFEVPVRGGRADWYRFEEVARKTVSESEIPGTPIMVDRHRISPASGIMLHSPPMPAPPDRSLLLNRLAGVLSILHDLGACMGEGLTIERSPAGRFVVKGIVESDGRLLLLERAIGNLPDIDVRITTPRLSAPTEKAIARASKQSIPPHVAPPVLEEWLIKRKCDPQQISRLATAGLLESEEALQHAWAVRHLQAVFSPAESELLSPANAKRIVAIQNFHERRMNAALSRLQHIVRPLLSRQVGPIALVPNSQSQFQVVQAIHQEILWLLVNGWGAPAVSPLEAESRFEQSLNQALAITPQPAPDAVSQTAQAH